MQKMKNKIRFLKKITILCVIMNLIITLVTLFICLMQQEISAGILSALLGAWSIELGLTALIKNTESKEDKQNVEIEEKIISQPDPTKDSI